MSDVHCCIVVLIICNTSGWLWSNQSRLTSHSTAIFCMQTLCPRPSRSNDVLTADFLNDKTGKKYLCTDRRGYACSIHAKYCQGQWVMSWVLQNIIFQKKDLLPPGVTFLLTCCSAPSQQLLSVTGRVYHTLHVWKTYVTEQRRRQWSCLLQQ